jgi:hypothetical protein
MTKLRRIHPHYMNKYTVSNLWCTVAHCWVNRGGGSQTNRSDLVSFFLHTAAISYQHEYISGYDVLRECLSSQDVGLAKCCRKKIPQGTTNCRIEHWICATKHRGSLCLQLKLPMYLMPNCRTPSSQTCYICAHPYGLAALLPCIPTCPVNLFIQFRSSSHALLRTLIDAVEVWLTYGYLLASVYPF